MVGFIFAARGPGHAGRVVAAECVRGATEKVLFRCMLFYTYVTRYGYGYGLI